MALDTAMKIEEILKISLYVTSRDSQLETRGSSTPTRHLKFLDDQSMDKRTVHRILSEISEVFGYSVNATKLIPIELKKATSSGAHINEMLEAPIFSKPLILLYVLFMSFNRFFEFRKKKDEFPSILYDLKKLKFCVALGEEEYTKKIKVIEQTPEEKKQEDEFYKRLNRAYYSFKDVSAVKMMETIEETYEYFYALTFPKRNVDNFFSNDKFESFKKIEEFIKKNRKSQSEGTLRDFLAGTDVLSQLRLDKEFYQPFLKLLLIREELTSEEHCVIEKTIDDISAPELSEALIDNIKSYIKRYGLDENQSDSYREELLADFNPQARKRLENYLYIAQDYDHAF